MDKLFEKLNLNTSRGMQNVGIFLILLIIGMIVINTSFSKETVSSEKQMVDKIVLPKEETFEDKLKVILESMNGVQDVNVMVAYENTIEKVPLYDTKEITTVTEEEDNQGGARKTKEVNNEFKIAYEENGSTKTALVKQNIMPKMVGVIVTYAGSTNSVTKENILNAVMAVTGLSSNKIQVFAK